MAQWCLSTGQTPATWRELTRIEREAFTELISEALERSSHGSR